MASIHTILIKKNGSEEIINSENDFHIKCLNFHFKVGESVKTLYSVDWKDENGVDVYFPKSSMLEPYDIKVEFGYVGKEISNGTPNVKLAMDAIFTFWKFLTGNDTASGSGTDLTIYSPYTGIGRQNIYAESLDDENVKFMVRQDSGNKYNENVLTFSVTFKVCDPLTQVILNG